jgi:hypothetical protein
VPQPWIGPNRAGGSQALAGDCGRQHGPSSAFNAASMHRDCDYLLRLEYRRNALQMKRIAETLAPG